MMLPASPFPEIVVVLAGLILGSFFNVVIWRLPRGESVVRPRSHCPGCGRTIPAIENVPILSYLALRGRCAGCGGRISLRYPLVEALTGAGALVVWLAILRPASATGSPWSAAHAVLQAVSLLALIPVAFIDMDHLIIPDLFSLSGVVIALAASFMPGDTTPLQSALGVLAGGGTLFVFGEAGKILFRKPEAMGFGDVKLMAWLGALWGWQVALVAVFLASLAGAVVGVALLAVRKLAGNHLIPFGPFLALGTWLAVLYGKALVLWYLSLSEPLFRLLH
jgi:leader peptidase (prepilin peptidase)/N-methyltransferase